MAEFISVQQAMNERLAAEQASQAERADTTNRELNNTITNTIPYDTKANAAG